MLGFVGVLLIDVALWHNEHTVSTVSRAQGEHRVSTVAGHRVSTVSTVSTVAGHRVSTVSTMSTQ